MKEKVDFEIVEIGLLRGHEEVIKTNLDTRISKLERKGFYKPIIADKSSMVILDGHHKWTAAGILGLKRVPVILIEYIEDESVTVGVWPGCGRDNVSKKEVLSMGLSEELFPPKTSRHFFPFEIPQIQIPLDDLLD
ncbi:MAG: hypothetical protein CMA12_05125 [Euryarchaeota archaeon]|nr:hypothetical protein [Euryarchaeota archaeon]OUW22217.1 MAG: hypothetical protein CBD33_02990 [Euryarchaeota archaeon TMED173]|tara:strand:- start:648 stop:1055 length:408 start_codon:yes stop_codon:yes gene_type:complete